MLGGHFFKKRGTASAAFSPYGTDRVSCSQLLPAVLHNMYTFPRSNVAGGDC